MLQLSYCIQFGFGMFLVFHIVQCHVYAEAYVNWRGGGKVPSWKKDRL
jgi:hypothetical protein